MSLTQQSNDKIKFFLRIFNEFNVDENEKSKEIYKSLYKDIADSDKALSLLRKKGKVNFDFKELRKLPNLELLDGHFAPKKIKDSLNKNVKGLLIATVTMLNINVKVNLLLLDEKDFNRMKYLEKKIIYALKLIYFCLLYKNNNVLKRLEVHLYLSGEKKLIPENKLTTLGTNECNTAVTYACTENGSILVFREEEWEKVLLHELFHSLCLDFAVEKYKSLRNEIKSLFDIKSDFEISETYTEFWALVVNACFVSYGLLGEERKMDNYILFVRFFLQIEKVFSIFQCIKILNYMGLRYINLITDTEIDRGFRELLYKEDTNVFAYYILKMVLLYHVDDFLLWCKKVNINILSFDKTPQNFTKFLKFIKSKYKTTDFLKDIEKMELFYNTFMKSYKGDNKDELMETMRMTIVELKLK